MTQIITLLADAKAPDSSIQMAGSLVGSLTADKVVVAQKVEGGITM
jgi:hypothetical protein